MVYHKSKKVVNIHRLFREIDPNKLMTSHLCYSSNKTSLSNSWRAFQQYWSW